MKTDAVTMNPLPAVADGGRARSAAAVSAASEASRNVALDQAMARVARAAQSREQAGEAAVEANRRLAEKGSELTIEFDDVMDRMVFRLVDSQTGEVVRQIPSEEVLAIARALADDTSAGVLLRTDA